MTTVLIVLGLFLYLLSGVAYLAFTLGHKNRKEKWWEIVFYPPVWVVFGMIILYAKVMDK